MMKQHREWVYIPIRFNTPTPVLGIYQPDGRYREGETVYIGKYFNTVAPKPGISATVQYFDIDKLLSVGISPVENFTEPLYILPFNHFGGSGLDIDGDMITVFMEQEETHDADERL